MTTEWFVETCNDQGLSFGLAVNKKLHSEQSAYQKIEIYESTKFGNLMVIDDCIMLTQRDNFLYHEMLIHPALFTHKNPKKVAIIGGGDCGSLQQVLLHDSVKEVIQVDIDERVTRLSEEYFPELCANNNDPRAKFEFIDGIAWMAEQAENWDVIIIDSTDPMGPAEGLFGPEFIASCFAALKPGGVFVQQSESPLLHGASIIQPIINNLKQAKFSSINLINFPQPVYPSGWWSALIAGKDQDVNQFREQAIVDKNFSTKYYNHKIHQAALVQPEFVKIQKWFEFT